MPIPPSIRDITPVYNEIRTNASHNTKYNKPNENISSSTPDYAMITGVMDSQLETRQGSIDASLLSRILTGELQATSIIEETQDLKQVVLQDHPHFSKVLDLARKSSGMERLKQSSLFENRSPVWTSSLAEHSFSRVLFQLFNQQATGFLRIRLHKRQRVIALSAGLPISASSNIDAESFGKFLMMRKAVTAPVAEHIIELTKQHSISFGAALLKANALSTDQLHQYLEQYSRFQLFPAFEWTQGQVDFFPDDRAMMMPPLINLSLMGIMRAGIWGNRPIDLPTVKRASKRLLNANTRLHMPNSLGPITWELHDIESKVATKLQGGTRLESIVLSLDTPLEQAKAILAAYLFNAMGAIEVQTAQRMQNLKSASLAPPTGAQSQEHQNQELNQFLKKQESRNIARNYLVSGQPQKAQKLFQQLYSQNPESADIMSYLALATLLSSPKTNLNRALTLAKRSLSTDPNNPIAHATMSRCFSIMDTPPGSAKNHREKAIELSASNTEWQTEILALLNMSTSESSPADSKGPGNPSVGITLGLLTIIILFITSNLLGYGELEYQYRPSDRFFFARRISLILVGLIGICAFERLSPIPAILSLFRKFPIKYALFGLLWGLILGYFSPIQQIKGALLPVLGMGILHVVAGEIFFRGMLTRIFLSMSPSPTVATALSASIFSLYHLSYTSLWFNLDLSMKLYWLGLTAVAVGLPFAWLYYKTRTIIPSLIAYTLAHLSILWASFLSTI